MIETKNVRGTQKSVPALEVNIDTVYLRENITAIDEEDFKGWQYDEKQYSIQEYIKLTSDIAVENESQTSEVMVDFDFRISSIELGM